MPGDSFALAVLVCCEQEFVTVFKCPLKFGDRGFLRVVDYIDRLKFIIDVDGKFGPRLLAVGFRQLGGFRSQVADVAHRGHDGIAVAKVAGDLLRLRW
ncbi:unannotated protein [freshwater metagenome]|uniref:Unannotated protein n=1 Tax=freshwater metagenome TaxID=449393 RepID=A0A6J7ATM3_9ZZZZ